MRDARGTQPVDRLPSRYSIAECSGLFGNPGPDVLAAFLSGTVFHAGRLTPSDPDFACNANRDLHAGAAP